jgi:hypothetical protein
LNDREQYEAAERQHLLIQSFLPRVDSKVSALFAVAAGELAILCLNVTRASLITWWAAIPLAVALLLIAASVILLYRSAFPHLDGGHSSLIYFKEVAKRTEVDFQNDWKAADYSRLLNDVLGQVWGNSVIVSKKFFYLKWASISIAASLLPWGVYLAASSFITSKMIQIPS